MESLKNKERSKKLEVQSLEEMLKFEYADERPRYFK